MTDLKFKIVARVKTDLEEIEKAISNNLTPYLDLVSETARHILFAGGKRLRPLLMVLSARLCGYSGNHDKYYSTIFEYLHAATLLHDDLVDGARIRRGRQVAHGIYGAPTAVLVGDFLLARGLSIAAASGQTKIIEVIAGITENMSQGEIHQLMRRQQLSLSEQEYIEVIQRKTAVLIQGACKVGAIIADATAEQEAALSTFGYNLGLAFQMADDLLDYTADTTELGKEIGVDLREGKITLPVIYALRDAQSSEREMLERIIINPEFTQEEFEKLVKYLNDCGGIEYTRNKAAGYVKKAKQALEIFKAGFTLETLLEIADYSLDRGA